jgi:hypothetical protein
MCPSGTITQSDVRAIGWGTGQENGALFIRLAFALMAFARRSHRFAKFFLQSIGGTIVGTSSILQAAGSGKLRQAVAAAKTVKRVTGNDGNDYQRCREHALLLFLGTRQGGRWSGLGHRRIFIAPRDPVERRVDERE